VSVLKDLSLEVVKGEFLSVVGPSGCGKTTLLYCLAGLLLVDTGEVSFRGKSISETPEGLAVVFQDYGRSLLPWRNNLENVIFGMRRIEGLSGSERALRANELLDAVGLASSGRRYPWECSGGMQQRVAIARSLASRSEVLLLDEPFAAVDAQTRCDMQDLVLELKERYSQTVLLVTHDIEEAIYMADRVCVLSMRPTAVVAEILVDLPSPRDQISTKEHPRFLELRHQVLQLVRAQKQGRGAT
jgi:NitT/TauT family transport system ATP-binding protein